MNQNDKYDRKTFKQKFTITSTPSKLLKINHVDKFLVMGQTLLQYKSTIQSVFQNRLA